MFDLDAQEDEVQTVPDGDFEPVQLEDNHVGSFKVGFRLPLEVRTTLIEFLQSNVHIFAITSMG